MSLLWGEVDKLWRLVLLAMSSLWGKVNEISLSLEDHLLVAIVGNGVERFVGHVTEETVLGWDLSEDVDLTIVAEVDEESFFGVLDVGEHRDF